MMKLKTMMNYTPKKVRRNANGVRTRNVTIPPVRARILRSVRMETIMGTDKIVIARAVATRETRTLIFRFVDFESHNDLSQAKCWVHCDCEYFRYHCEMMLTLRGSSANLVSNGEYPSIRINLRGVAKAGPFLCKHLWKAAPLAVKARMATSKRTMRRLKAKINEVFPFELMF